MRFRYKLLHDQSCKLLIKTGISELPVKPTVIARSFGISILKESNTHILSTDILGLSILSNNKWYIVYDDKIKTELARIVIAHELGHIFLHHKLSGPVTCRLFKLPTVEEQEAEMFALQLLSPTCVLSALHIHTPTEIAKTCQIPIEYAKVRAKQLKALSVRNDILKSSLERQVYDNFINYIQNQKSKL